MNNFYFDKIIEVDLLKGLSDEKPIVIKSVPNGPKPNISLEVNMLPGLLIYGCTITLVNMDYMADLKTYTHMVVRAGYRYSTLGGGQKTISITSAIFTSYQESPNPDGKTVLKGVIVGNIGDLLTSHPISLVAHTPLTVKELINNAVMGASGYSNMFEYQKSNVKGAGILTVHMYIPDYLTNTVVQPDPGHKTLQVEVNNGLEMITRIYNKLYAHFKAMGYTYVQHLYGTELSCLLLEFSDNLKTTDRVININSVISASYNEQLCTLVAPWDPEVIPGAIVRISSNYFVGNNTPNIVDMLAPAQPPFLTPQEIASGVGIYRVLTSYISFGTVDEDNKMELLLLPVTYAEKTQASKTNNYIQNLYSDEKSAMGTISIEIGKADPAQDAQKVWGAGLKGHYTTETLILLTGTTFAQLGQEHYEAPVRDMDKSFYLNRSVYNKEIVVDVKDDGSLVKGYLAGGNSGIVVSRAYAWPLILLATYNNYTKNHVQASKVNLKDPDMLPVGTEVIIPLLDSDNQTAIESMKNDKNLFKVMAEYYIPYIGTYKHWAKDSIKNLYNMYLMLGGEL